MDKNFKEELQAHTKKVLKAFYDGPSLSELEYRAIMLKMKELEDRGVFRAANK